MDMHPSIKIYIIGILSLTLRRKIEVQWSKSVDDTGLNNGHERLFPGEFITKLQSVSKIW